jgi:thioredoxin-related protein
MSIERMLARGCLALLLVALATAPLAAAEADLWTEDAAAATKLATEGKKDLLINFTGSDWCGWCKKLDKEVFSQEAFRAEAPKHFVFLKLDFPRRRELSEETKKQNAEWKSRMPVPGFPTIILADAAGKPYASTGYRRGGADAYLEHLAELRAIKTKRDEAFAAAAKAEGIEKAKALDAALSTLDSEIAMASYGDVIDEIVALDPDNKAGLKAKYGAIALIGKMQAAMSKRDFDGAIALADEALKTLGDSGQQVQDVLFQKSLALYNKKDKKGAKASLEAALEAAPDAPQAARIKMILERAFKDVE